MSENNIISGRGKKVIVGMSGGVDSSVCVYLLKEQGYEVTGVSLRLWEDNDEVCNRAGHVGCCGASAMEDARRICAFLSIPFYTLPVQDLFREKVVDYFCNSYINGRTPNPCIVCNKLFKWGVMRTKAQSMGADYIATGHYAIIKRTDCGRYTIKRAVDDIKDQSYFLYSLTQDDLEHTLFPLGTFNKDRVRDIAKKASLPVYDKKDSQDICFVPDGDYRAFLKRQLSEDELSKPGDFVADDGTVVGKHQGVCFYTIGQRKGLGLALGKPVFVNSIDADNNTIHVGDDESCYTSLLFANNICHMGHRRLDENASYFAKIRYRDSGAYCQVSYTGAEGDRIRVCFDKPVRAVTPGQAIVLYEDDCIAAGGIIE